MENRRMMWVMFAEDLDSQISDEIVTARECQEQIDKALAKMREAADSESIMALAEGIAYNRSIQQIYLERAAAVMELYGILSPKEDTHDLQTIEEKHAAFLDLVEGRNRH